MPEVKRIAIDKIKLDERTQPRQEIDEDLVDEYRLAIEDGAKLPPVVVFFDGCHYWLADGYHRYHAESAIGSKEILAEVYNGGLREAILYSVGANDEHGKRRTLADKRKAAETLLADGEWGNWSDHEIARQCKVSNHFIAKIRDRLTRNVPSDNSAEPAETPSISSENVANSEIAENEADDSERTYTTKHGTVATMNTANIGKEKERCKTRIQENLKSAVLFALQKAADNIPLEMAEMMMAEAFEILRKRYGQEFTARLSASPLNSQNNG
ncbi:MAG: hypothetical protein WC374_12835 [Phycisphaerae bacterium]